MDLQRKLQQKRDELDMLQIANETLQAQCKVSTTSNPKPTHPHDGNPSGGVCLKCRVARTSSAPRSP